MPKNSDAIGVILKVFLSRVISGQEQKYVGLGTSFEKFSLQPRCFLI